MQLLYDNKNFIEETPTCPLNHLAVIMDGNGRWAQLRGLPRWKGHEMGVQSVRRLVEAARRLEIPVVTVFAFSSENWKRPENEVRILFGLLRRYFLSERQNLIRNDIRVSVFGRRDRVPPFVREAIDTLEGETKNCRRLHLRIALDYGSRFEIVEAVRSLAQNIVQHKMRPEQITEELLSENLSSSGIADPDLIIRTAGEQRISNFLLWQAAYAEIYFSPVLWPEFGRKDIDQALEDYSKRQRRFGKR